jgi:2-polyprenyl-6-methoxyphenol hydroxylase-like FAD-dependent oxidoreductase
VSGVVIAGAGPVGLMLACELGRTGLDVTVLDPLERRSERSPGVAINAACVEALDQRGLMEEIREDCFILPAVHFSLIFLDMTKQDDASEDAYMVPQSRVEELLENRAVSLGVDIRRGHGLVGLTQDRTGVTAAVRGPDGDYSLRGAYLVGCDGRHSTVRDLLGVTMTGTESPGCHGIVADVDISGDPTAMSGKHVGAYISDDGGIYTGAPSGPGLLRVMTVEYDRISSDHDTPVTADELEASVKRLTGAGLGACRPLWTSRFTDAIKVAERYRTGRVFLAGDAAHTIFPLNGFGLSTGIADAVNLGWKLAADLEGWAPPGLLDTYHRERHPVGAAACRTVRAQAEIVHPPERVGPMRDLLTDLLQFDDVQRYLIRLVSDLAVRYPLAESSSSPAHALLGARLPSLTLTLAEGTATVAEILRSGLGVLLDLSAGAADLSAAKDWPDRLTVVTAEPTAQIPASAVLVRPDGHVAWVRTGESDDRLLREQLVRWFGEAAQLSTPEGEAV